jgi:hypothetical protein
MGSYVAQRTAHSAGQWDEATTVGRPPWVGKGAALGRLGKEETACS